MFGFLKWSFLLSSKYSKSLQDIEEGKHDNEKCEEYCQNYKRRFDQELPDCQFKRNKSKIMNLIRKVKIDADGSVTEVQFDNCWRINKSKKILNKKNKLFDVF